MHEPYVASSADGSLTQVVVSGPANTSAPYSEIPTGGAARTMFPAGSFCPLTSAGVCAGTLPITLIGGPFGPSSGGLSYTTNELYLLSPYSHASSTITNSSGTLYRIDPNSYLVNPPGASYIPPTIHTLLSNLNQPYDIVANTNFSCPTSSSGYSPPISFGSQDGCLFLATKSGVVVYDLNTNSSSVLTSTTSLMSSGANYPISTVNYQGTTPAIALALPTGITYFNQATGASVGALSQYPNANTRITSVTNLGLATTSDPLLGSYGSSSSMAAIDNANQKVDLISTSGASTVLAGGGSQVPTLSGVPCLSAQFYDITAVHQHGPAGMLFVTDSGSSSSQPALDMIVENGAGAPNAGQCMVYNVWSYAYQSLGLTPKGSLTAIYSANLPYELGMANIPGSSDVAILLATQYSHYFVFYNTATNTMDTSTFPIAGATALPSMTNTSYEVLVSDGVNVYFFSTTNLYAINLKTGVVSTLANTANLNINEVMLGPSSSILLGSSTGSIYEVPQNSPSTFVPTLAAVIANETTSSGVTCHYTNNSTGIWAECGDTILYYPISQLGNSSYVPTTIATSVAVVGNLAMAGNTVYIFGLYNLCDCNVNNNYAGGLLSLDTTTNNLNMVIPLSTPAPSPSTIGVGSANGIVQGNYNFNFVSTSPTELIFSDGLELTPGQLDTVKNSALDTNLALANPPVPTNLSTSGGVATATYIPGTSDYIVYSEVSPYQPNSINFYNIKTGALDNSNYSGFFKRPNDYTAGSGAVSDGKFIYYIEAQSRDVVYNSLDTGVSGTLDFGGNPQGLALSPDQRTLYILQGDGTIVATPTEGYPKLRYPYYAYGAANPIANGVISGNFANYAPGSLVNCTSITYDQTGLYGLCFMGKNLTQPTILYVPFSELGNTSYVPTSIPVTLPQLSGSTAILSSGNSILINENSGIYSISKSTGAATLLTATPTAAWAFAASGTSLFYSYNNSTSTILQ